MIVLYKGKRGSGKTLTMVKDGLRYYQNGYKILRNFDCAFGDYISNEDILKLDKESNITNCVLMIDEVQIFFDSRRSMKNENINFSNFVQQIRKRHIHILGTSQYSNTVDLRFRQHTDIVAFPNFIKNLNVCEVLYVDITSMDDLLNSMNKSLDFIKVVFDAEPLFKLYNTEQMIK